jgi:ABC-type spermidine/putrescine transport system permease subunit II
LRVRRLGRRRTRDYVTLEHWLLPLPAFLLVAVGFLIPLLIIIVYSLTDVSGSSTSTALTLKHYERFVTDSTYWATLLKSMGFIAVASALVVSLTFPFAYFVATKVKPRRRFLWLFVAVLPFWTSYLLRVISALNFFGDNGVINHALQLAGLSDGTAPEFLQAGRTPVVVTFVYLLSPLGLLCNYLALERLDGSLLDAARDLGAGKTRALIRVTLPLVRTGMLAGFALSFVAMIGDYITPILVGGTDGIFFSSLLINQFGLSEQWSFGAMLSIALLMAVFVALALLRIGIGRVESTGEYTQAYKPDRAIGLRIYSMVFLALLYAPIVLLFLFALNPSQTVGFPIKGLTLHWVGQAFDDLALRDALWTSLQVATIAVASSLLLGTMAALYLSRAKGPLRSVYLSVISLPLLLPPVIFGLGALIALHAANVQRSLWTIIVGHVLLLLPVATFLVGARLEGIDRTQEMAARDLGAGRFRAFARVTLPQAIPGLLAAALIGFASSMDEFILTFLVTGAQTTLPLYIYGSIRFRISPALMASSALLISLSVLLTVAAAGTLAAARRYGSRASSGGSASELPMMEAMTR